MHPRTEAKVALCPCSTSGPSQRGLVATMLLPVSPSVPSTICETDRVASAGGGEQGKAAHLEPLQANAQPMAGAAHDARMAHHFAEVVVGNLGVPVWAGGRHRRAQRSGGRRTAATHKASQAVGCHPAGALRDHSQPQPSPASTKMLGDLRSRCTTGGDRLCR